MSRNVELLNYLKKRRSVPLPFLQNPGPSESELKEILEIATRVPDHGKLFPWRLIIYKGTNRIKTGENLALIAKENNPNIDEEKLEVERNQFLPAPLTIGVVSSPIKHKKIPQSEQVLSAAAVAINLVHGANALGFGTHWVSRWFSYDQSAKKMLGAKNGEEFVAFIHIGTPCKTLEDRERPNLKDVVTYWQN